MDRQAIGKLIRRIAKAAAIPSWAKLTPHSLRHSFVTLSLDAGAALCDVQRTPSATPTPPALMTVTAATCAATRPVA